MSEDQKRTEVAFLFVFTRSFQTSFEGRPGITHTSEELVVDQEAGTEDVFPLRSHDELRVTVFYVK